MTQSGRSITAINGLAWFLLGTVLTVILYPIFTTKVHSEHTGISIQNNSSSTIYASVFPSPGTAVSEAIMQSSESRLVFHKGEFTDNDFPREIRVQLTDNTQRIIMNEVFPITTSGTTMITCPSVFNVNDLVDTDEQMKSVEVEYLVRPTP